MASRNALTASRTGTKAPLAGKAFGTPGVRPAGTQDSTCETEYGLLRRSTNRYTGKRTGPEWLRARAAEDDRRRYEEMMAEMMAGPEH